jgi:predicted transcriptional regulator
MILVSTIVQTDYPSINLNDNVAFALSLMDDYDTVWLPVISEDKFVGLIGKTDLLDVDETIIVAALQDQLKKITVTKEAFFLTAVKLIVEQEVSMIAVVTEEQELAGVITANQLLKRLAIFNGIEEPGGMIVLEIDKRNFSFGEISRLIETNNAFITQLNSSIDTETGLAEVFIKINKTEISDIIATFQRFEYTVKYYVGEEQYANELKENYRHLLSYLNI